TILFGKIVVPRSGEMLDEVLVSLMLAPRTFTKENVVEIHCHGGMYLLQRVLQAVLESGARLAEPGEFTKRAFLNGRIDLSQAESIMDMISAKSQLSLDAATKRLEGRLGTKIQEYRKEILDLLVLLEVEIDYPEYEIEEAEQLDMAEKMAEIREKLVRLYKTADTGRMLNEGIRIALAGRPNMGKSTLLNALLGENRAIVTEIPGTTRDTLEEGMNLDGIPLRLIDTAGIRDASDPVERIGVARARQAMEESDLVLLLLEGAAEPLKEDLELLEGIGDRPHLVVRTKMDRNLSGVTEFGDADKTVVISAVTGEGMDELRGRIRELVMSGSVQASDGVYLANARQKQAVEQALSAVRSAENTMQMGWGTDLVSMDLQRAYDLLGELTGNSVQEDLVDTIFARFCLGK
ncbi:MAG: tRNA uridine-5-carboxymethylaminomethyl(34) synthesis GTPase MnmE, partial [Firmicutes bacterium]|nr:tRNA uridine-5-carboxymethylaminomethyl(34) synthesis GTPase MnmE [Bacillota bacterium]